MKRPFRKRELPNAELLATPSGKIRRESLQQQLESSDLISTVRCWRKSSRLLKVEELISKRWLPHC